jgi:hypothetical protein
VRIVYGNDAARAGQPYAGGSGLDANGRYQKNALTGIFVMKKDKWFGLRYKEHQTGEWEYASYRPDLTPLVVGDAAAQACAVCHLDAAPSRDWVYPANIFYSGASGALPQLPTNQPADQAIISSCPERLTTRVIRCRRTNRGGARAVRRRRGNSRRRDCGSPRRAVAAAVS